MLKTYWAQFFKEDGGPGYTVLVPDLPGCITEGNSWDEAYYMAQDAMRGWLSISLDDGEALPEASSRERVAALEVDEEMGPAELVMVTVSLPDEMPLLSDALWADLARAAHHEGLLVGEILTRAAREYLARHQSHV